MSIALLRNKLFYPKSQADLNSFELYYRHYLPKIFTYVSYRVSDQHIAEDLTATIFEKALSSFGSYSSERGAFSTWLFTIAHNSVANYIRDQRRQPNLVSVETLSQIEIAGVSPEQAIIETERFRQVIACLSQLDEREREVIALRFSSELKNQEVAKIMGITPIHVGVLLHRALNKLRQLLLKGKLTT